MRGVFGGYDVRLRWMEWVGPGWSSANRVWRLATLGAEDGHRLRDYSILSLPARHSRSVTSASKAMSRMPPLETSSSAEIASCSLSGRRCSAAQTTIDGSGSPSRPERNSVPLSGALRNSFRETRSDLYALFAAPLSPSSVLIPCCRAATMYCCSEAGSWSAASGTVLPAEQLRRDADEGAAAFLEVLEDDVGAFELAVGGGAGGEDDGIEFVAAGGQRDEP